MKTKAITIVAAVASCVCLAIVAAPIMQATEDFVTNETAKVERKIDVKVNAASNHIVRIIKAEDYVVKTNLLSKINRINDKTLGVVWEAIMVNGQLYYVATMPYVEPAAQ